MKSNCRRIRFLILLTLSLLLFSSTVDAQKIEDIEVHWPAGVESPAKTKDIFAAGPCLLLMKVTIDPIYKNAGSYPVCWGNGSNTIPPFPLGKGKVEGKTWANGVLIDSLGQVQTGSTIYQETRFIISEKGNYGGKMFLVPPQIRNLAGAFANQFKQYVRVTFEVFPLDADIEWGSSVEPPPPDPDQDRDEDPEKIPDPVNGTHWSVGGHPVHWQFRADGTVEAPGLWKGVWSKVEDGYQVTITHQGVSDVFLVKFSADGQSFTAYKNGGVYRRGVLVK